MDPEQDTDQDVDDVNSGSPLALPPSEVADAVSSSCGYEIVSYPADFTIEGLVNKAKKNQLTIPGFQRKFVWTHRQASRLIESFLLGLPVPALFLYIDPDTGVQQVIDGQQRLKSCIQFFAGQFQNASMSKPRVFQLDGLSADSPYNGLSYNDLESKHPAWCSRLNDSVMRAFVIKQLDPKDATSIYHIFERLNTGGTRLLGQEIRNCVYHGVLNDTICKLNTDKNWRAIIGVPAPDDRMRDVEMILRFMALYWFSSDYKKPMKDFLSTAMRTKRNLSPAEAESVEHLFKETCHLVASRLGDRPFHRRGGMNPAVFDCVFTVLARNMSTAPVDLEARFTSLVESEEFVAQSSYRTTDADAVKKRLELAANTLIG